MTPCSSCVRRCRRFVSDRQPQWDRCCSLPGRRAYVSRCQMRASWCISPRAGLNEIYMKHTGQPLQKIEEALERDFFMTAETAKDFGLVDKVIDRRPEIPPLAVVS